MFICAKEIRDEREEIHRYENRNIVTTEKVNIMWVLIFPPNPRIRKHQMKEIVVKIKMKLLIKVMPVLRNFMPLDALGGKNELVI